VSALGALLRPRERSAASITFLALLAACSKESPSENSIAILEKALTTRPDIDEPAVTLALESFVSAPPRDALPLIEEIASDATLTEEVRFTAVAVLGRIREPGVRETLEKIATTDSSELIRDEAREALRRAAGGP